MADRTDIPAGVFAPRPSRQESKADTTNNAARQILDGEVRARELKTAKLKAMRVAREEAEAQAAAEAGPKPAAKPRKARAKSA